MFLSILLLVIVAAAVPPPIPGETDSAFCRTLTRDSLLPCFSSLIDTNGDNQLNQTEITTFLAAQNISAQTVIMRLCDTNGDNMLNMTDWNAPTACAQTQPIITRICYICVKAGWTPPQVGKKKDPK